MTIACNQYTIHINHVGKLQKFINDGSYSSIIVLVDNNTYSDCLPLLREMMNVQFSVIEIPAGEVSKNLDSCERIWQKMIALKVDRHSLFINLGGGVIGDMGGFVASTYMRGIDFIQVPTSLLAQVDASVGGKLGIDFQNYKNMIGLFQDPSAVFIFSEFLKTLPERELKSGFAEVIKHNLISDAEGYRKCISIDLDKQDWPAIIKDSILLKKGITENDPTEKGKRKILNFGHTLGHAIESFNLDKEVPFLHGEAIAIGMIMEAYLSHKTSDAFSIDDARKIKDDILAIYGHHPFKVPDLDALMPYLVRDKKNNNQSIKFSLLERIGSCSYDVTVDENWISKSIDFYCK